ncbi:MAG: hypothetical protein AUG49_15720 [Catenulispora sp. 13_1_20CM_3_70_7]|nr:MAG: hypothetical protein AUG49_15720 [Catenulispora sp. 13_1_20CM_3_70_7]
MNRERRLRAAYRRLDSAVDKVTVSRFEQMEAGDEDARTEVLMLGAHMVELGLSTVDHTGLVDLSTLWDTLRDTIRTEIVRRRRSL